MKTLLTMALVLVAFGCATSGSRLEEWKNCTKEEAKEDYCEYCNRDDPSQAVFSAYQVAGDMCWKRTKIKMSYDEQWDEAFLAAKDQSLCTMECK